ncbi:hypothetical protein C1N92_20305 [Bacillus velezensis]|uniref:hypothetical protein n=1 Tax=Bacillus velezensis TaxID=492670 RepID=UPI000D736DF1|nr:hypothetical protein [Bacillus velezensis]AWQ17045.1 hypothetical protein C1N92_20305 [Bacillus velezensis]NCT27971.1 hypothetical protein [Bacillus velezensis]UWD95710.1 hypothetical protein NX081_11430 [Bacillus velezensis]WFP05490.1 hypothetical protein JEQ22_19960 [Bacillus velezensis]
MASVPKRRKERVKFLIDKLGEKTVSSTIAVMTDREVKRFFDEMYPLYKDRENFSSDYQTPTCLVCESPTYIKWDCDCGNAVIDEDDSVIQDLKNRGEYEKIRKQFGLN